MTNQPKQDQSMTKNSIADCTETVNTTHHDDNRIWNWYNRAAYKWRDIFTGEWKRYYDTPQEAAIRLCISYGHTCDFTPGPMRRFLLRSQVHKWYWSDEVVDDILDNATFVHKKLSDTTLTVALCLLILPRSTTIKEIVTMSGLSSNIVTMCLRTLVKQGVVVKSDKKYMLLSTARNIYYLKDKLCSSNNLLLLVVIYILNPKNRQVFSGVTITSQNAIILEKTHPHFYPSIATPARKKIFSQEEERPIMVTQTPPTTQGLDVWGPISYDIPKILVDLFDAPEHILEGFETVKICCPDLQHEDTTPSCVVFSAGNAYCHGCHRKYKDIREVVQVSMGDLPSDVFELDAVMEWMYPFITGGLVDYNTITYQQALQTRSVRKEVNAYELQDARERYEGRFGEFFSHDWKDISTFSHSQLELFSAGYRASTLEAWHVYCFEIDPWYKIRIPLVVDGLVMGEQAISTRRDRARGAGKYFTTPNMEKSKYVYGYLQQDSSCMVVEGLKDAMMVWQRGFKNVCTTLGATMSDEQSDYLAARYKVVFMAYDNDRSGKQGCLEAYNKLVARGVHVEPVVYQGKDPALTSIAAWKVAVVNACKNAGIFCPSEVWDY